MLRGLLVGCLPFLLPPGPTTPTSTIGPSLDSYEQMFNEKKLILSKNVLLSKNVNPIVPMTNAFAVVEKINRGLKVLIFH